MSPRRSQTGRRRPPAAVRRDAGPPVRTTPRFLAVGKVLRPHGVRGEVRLEIHTGSPSHLAEVQTVYIGERHRPCLLEASRQHQGVLLIKLQGYDDRIQADALRGELISVDAADAVPLKPGEYYHHDIVGLEVVSDQGEVLGQVAEIIETGANDVYLVRGPGGDLLLPAIKSVILNIDARRMTVRLIEGLRP